MCLIIQSSGVSGKHPPKSSNCPSLGDLIDPLSYGFANGYYAYSIGTTSCNIGTDVLQWVELTDQHPVIMQNMYRLHEGRFEQVGMSWLKHGFAALTGDICGCTCQNPVATGASIQTGSSSTMPSSAGGLDSGTERMTGGTEGATFCSCKRSPVVSSAVAGAAAAATNRQPTQPVTHARRAWLTPDHVRIKLERTAFNTCCWAAKMGGAL